MAQRIKPFLWLGIFLAATAAGVGWGLEPAKTVFGHFTTFVVEMMTLVPFICLLVGLFDVWFPRERVQQHIGREAGVRGILLVIALAMLQVGPLYGAFPVAYLLHQKGAGIRNIFIYLGAFSCLKIPMVGLEIGYLGIPFTLARTLISLPVFIGIGFLMEGYLKDRPFVIQEPTGQQEGQNRSVGGVSVDRSAVLTCTAEKGRAAISPQGGRTDGASE